MKKIISSLLFATVIFAGTGCLKDKGFEDHKYGINDPDDSPVGIGFPEAVNKINNRSINALTTIQTLSDPTITLFGGDAAKQDIHVNIVLNPTLVTDYNTANGTSLVPFTAAQYNVPTLKVTIPAGQKLGKMSINFPNASLIDPLKTYGFGFSIASIDEPGYTIASNLKNFVMLVAIKNIYDGIYSVVSGKVTRYTGPGVPANDALSGSLVGNPDVQLITAGPTTLKVPIPANPNPGTFYWAYGNNSQVAGIDGVTIVVNSTTNLVTVSSPGNATLANWTGSAPGITYNRYDPATKTFYLAFRWNPTTTTREYEIVLKYKGPR